MDSLPTLSEYAKKTVYFQVQCKDALFFLEYPVKFVFHSVEDGEDKVFMSSMVARGDLVACRVGHGYAEFDVAPNVILTMWNNTDVTKAIASLDS